MILTFCDRYRGIIDNIQNSQYVPFQIHKFLFIMYVWILNVRFMIKVMNTHRNKIYITYYMN